VLLLGLGNGPDRPESSGFNRSIADPFAHLDGGGDCHTSYTSYTYAHHPAVPNPAADPIHDGYTYIYRVHDLDAFADLIAYLYAPTTTHRYAATDLHPAAPAV
jgi:hypothetical protein